jgi:uncharacterized membrane protein
MPTNSTLDMLWTICDALFRWSHIAGVVVGLGALSLLHFLRARTSEPAQAEALLRHPLAPRLFAWLRWAAALGWTSGMLLLFAHYYHSLLGPALLEANLPLDAHEALTKANGHPNVRAWLPGFLALLAGYGAYELCFAWTRGAAFIALAALASCAAWIALGWTLDVHAYYSGRAVWVHLGAMGGGVVAGNVWFRIWPAQQRLLDALRAGASFDGAESRRDLELVRARVAHCVYAGLAVLMFMLSNHYPLLYGDNPWPWPFAAAGVLVVSGVSVAFADWLGRRRG